MKLVLNTCVPRGLMHFTHLTHSSTRLSLTVNRSTHTIIWESTLCRRQWMTRSRLFPFSLEMALLAPVSQLEINLRGRLFYSISLIFFHVIYVYIYIYYIIFNMFQYFFLPYNSCMYSSFSFTLVITSFTIEWKCCCEEYRVYIRVQLIRWPMFSEIRILLVNA